MKKDLQELLEKQVDRKDFLKHVAYGVVALTGVSALTKSLTSIGGPRQQTGNGFGAGAYGGNKVSR